MSTSKTSIFLPFYILLIYLGKRYSGFVAFLKKYWNGEGTLAAAIFKVGLGGIIATTLVIIILANALPPGRTSSAVLAFAALFGFIWYIFSLFSIWSCAKNASKKIYGDLAKIFVVLAIMFLAYGALGGLLA